MKNSNLEKLREKIKSSRWVGLPEIEKRLELKESQEQETKNQLDSQDVGEIIDEVLKAGIAESQGVDAGEEEFEKTVDMLSSEIASAEEPTPGETEQEPEETLEGEDEETEEEEEEGEKSEEEDKEEEDKEEEDTGLDEYVDEFDAEEEAPKVDEDYDIVEGYLVTEDELPVDNLDELEDYLRDLGILEADEKLEDVWDKVYVYTSEDSPDLQEGFVLLERKKDTRIVRKGKLVVGPEKTKIRIKRKRYERRRKALLRIKRKRARLKREMRGGRVSPKEYKREIRKRITGTFRRKRERLKPGRKGFERIKVGESLWDKLSTYVPADEVERFREISGEIFDKKLEYLSKAILERDAELAIKYLGLIEDSVNAVTTYIAREIHPHLYEEVSDEIEVLNNEYNELIDEIEFIIDAIKHEIEEGDFDRADDYIVDLYLVLQEFLGLYDEEEYPEDEYLDEYEDEYVDEYEDYPEDEFVEETPEDEELWSDYDMTFDEEGEEDFDEDEEEDEEDEEE